MIGVVIPVHNEEDFLRGCLLSVQVAARHSGLMGEQVRIVVVLDACTDRSAQLASALQVECLQIAARSVGTARAVGARYLLQQGARWLAFTDADSVVSPDWLPRQLALGSDAVCGTVSVLDWALHGARGTLLRERFYDCYRDHDGHRHIHGANLGVSAAAYERAGGFSALTCGEDVALVQALAACGVQIAWSAAPRVQTSSRFACRARGGFGDTLHRLWN
jgi:glycosyltransferase involved in cell wall biosynthesis